jgi:hypothetical protein
MDRLGADPPGADRLGADRLRVDRLGADPPGADRLGADPPGADRLRVGRARIVDRESMIPVLAVQPRLRVHHP